MLNLICKIICKVQGMGPSGFILLLPGEKAYSYGWRAYFIRKLNR
jgi:hypothetical protein